MATAARVFLIYKKDIYIMYIIYLPILSSILYFFIMVGYNI